MPKVSSTLCSVIALACFSALSLQARTFTNSSGRSIEAEIASVEGDNVVLKMGGKSYPVPIKSLSPADQTYIKEWATNNEGAAAEADANWGAWPKMISVDIGDVKSSLKKVESTEENY
ncbi:MAG: hypothetical protein AAF226_17930, partial [Verrucomicrobiota bacterium]